MSYTMVWFNKEWASLIRVLQLRKHTHAQCALHNTPLKSPYSSLCSGNSDPLFTIPASNYNSTLSPSPSPWLVQAGSWAISVIYKTIPCMRHGYIEAILCLSGEPQKLHLIRTNTHTHIYILAWQNCDKGGPTKVWPIKKQILHGNM